VPGRSQLADFKEGTSSLTIAGQTIVQGEAAMALRYFAIFSSRFVAEGRLHTLAFSQFLIVLHPPNFAYSC